jgi:hypothetical protein
MCSSDVKKGGMGVSAIRKYIYYVKLINKYIVKSFPVL